MLPKLMDILIVSIDVVSIDSIDVSILFYSY